MNYCSLQLRKDQRKNYAIINSTESGRRILTRSLDSSLWSGTFLFAIVYGFQREGKMCPVKMTSKVKKSPINKHFCHFGFCELCLTVFPPQLCSVIKHESYLHGTLNLLKKVINRFGSLLCSVKRIRNQYELITLLLFIVTILVS